MKLRTTVVDLSEEFQINCPHCEGLCARGRFFVELYVDGEGYVLCDVSGCCGKTVMPMLVLFESLSLAQESGNRLITQAFPPNALFNLPLLSRELAVESFADLFAHVDKTLRS